MCVSTAVHQPWASLLIAGIKTVEGREWPTAHRVRSQAKKIYDRTFFSEIDCLWLQGRLWIASTVQACDPSEAEEMRQDYDDRVSRGEQEELPWPEHFPSSMLLGCIEVTDCIDQDEYRERCQKRELVDEGNGSSYLFVVEEPTQLLVPLRVSGQHKIWKMPAKTAAMARAGLGSQRSLKKKGKKPSKKKTTGVSEADLDESDDIAVALAASLGAEANRVPGDVGVATDLSVVDLRPTRPPPCAVSVLPHSTDLSQLKVEVLQGGMAVVRGFLRCVFGSTGLVVISPVVYGPENRSLSQPARAAGDRQCHRGFRRGRRRVLHPELWQSGRAEALHDEPRLALEPAVAVRFSIDASSCAFQSKD